MVQKLKKGIYKLYEVKCGLCNSNNHLVLSETDMYGLPMKVVLCKACGLVYTRERLEEKSLKSFYNNEYRPLDRATPLPNEDFFELERKKGKLIYNFLLKKNLLPEKKSLVIEIGCGAGGILSVFNERGYQILGCDVGDQYLKFGINNYKLRLINGGIKEIIKYLSKQQYNVGLIIYEQVFEHLLDPQAELTEINKLMDNNSLLYVGVPGIKNIGHHYGHDFLRYLQFPHLMHFELQTLKLIFEKENFICIYGTERIVAVFKKTFFKAKKSIISENRPLSMLTFLTKSENQRKDNPIKFIQYCIWYSCSTTGVSKENIIKLLEKIKFEEVKNGKVTE